MGLYLNIGRHAPSPLELPPGCCVSTMCFFSAYFSWALLSGAVKIHACNPGQKYAGTPANLCVFRDLSTKSDSKNIGSEPFDPYSPACPLFQF